MFAPEKGYEEEYLGKPAVFLIPSSKLTRIEFSITSFLLKNYGHAWTKSTNVKGYWMGKLDGDYTRFEVSFIGKEKIPNLKNFLANIAYKIKEESIYLLCGSDAWKIYSQKKNTSKEPRK
ncbi:MAG: hypothetical protein AAB784_00470 [Patescibacteria group bacterium]